MIFDEDSMFREKSETEDKSQGRTSDSSREEDSSDSDGDKQEATQEQPRPLRRSVRVMVPSTRYGWDEDHVFFALVIEAGEPEVTEKRSRQMITTSGLQPLSKRWESLDRNQTWRLVDLSKDSKAVGCRWIFRKKDNEQYRVRLVVKRYAQKEGIDYNEIFSLIVKHTSIRMLLALITQFDLELRVVGYQNIVSAR